MHNSAGMIADLPNLTPNARGWCNYEIISTTSHPQAGNTYNDTLVPVVKLEPRVRWIA